jgi:hypothetical protein
MATFKGFAPSWYEGQQNAGLGIYVAPGSVNGTEVNGAVVYVPANATTQVYVTAAGAIQTGSSVPGGSYGIATVVAGTIITGGNTVAGLKGPLGQWAGLSTDNGILSITDIRT